MSTDHLQPAARAIAREHPESLIALARAAVHAGTVTTHYLRGGCGDLIVLLDDSPAAPSPDPLFELLATAFRVVAPELSGAAVGSGPSELAFSTWLRGFLDGLGASDASIVARNGCALATLAFALTEPDRVRNLVLCFRDAPDPLDAGSPLAEQLDDARCRILLVREPPDPHAASDRQSRHEAIVDFLRRGASHG